jgi:hypothetical protein
MLSALGLNLAVIVQPSIYGTENRFLREDGAPASGSFEMAEPVSAQARGP